MSVATVSEPVDSFRQFQEKIARAVEVVKRAQTEKKALEQEIERLRTASKERAREWDAKERELVALRREREEVRERVEKLLEQIEGLTESGE
jgi:DNA repair exonuclease SbcCD ATPase subunit